MSISKNGVVTTRSTIHNIINNPCETNTKTDWSFDSASTLSNGVLTLTGTSPYITSVAFPVDPNEIIVFEFTVSLPTPSTTTGGPGLYLGTKYGDATNVYYWNSSGNLVTFDIGTTNPYFIWSYNSTAVNRVKTYILGKNISVGGFIPKTEGNGTIYILQVPNTSTYIRSGYNSNTNMIIQFTNLKLYSLYKKIDENSSNKKIGKGYLSFSNYIEV